MGLDSVVFTASGLDRSETDVFYFYFCRVRRAYIWIEQIPGFYPTLHRKN